MTETNRLRVGLIGVLLVSLTGCGPNDSSSVSNSTSQLDDDRETTGSSSTTGDSPADGSDNIEEKSSRLERLMIDGQALHDSLSTSDLASLPDLPTKTIPPSNPYLSSDPEFVESMARGASQGNLASNGIQTALYSRYVRDGNDLGIYGLEAETDADADERETAVREIWAYNVSLERARIHRDGRIILLVWSDDGFQDCWEEINANVIARLTSSD